MFALSDISSYSPEIKPDLPPVKCSDKQREEEDYE